MNKKEFIIQYVLAHKEMPAESLLTEIDNANLFDDSIDEVTPIAQEDKYADFVDIRRGNHIVCKEKFQVNSHITLPKGFVMRVSNFNRLAFAGDRENEDITLGVNMRIEGNIEHRTYHYKDVTKEWLFNHFEVLKDNVDVSVVNCERVHIKTKITGVKMYDHTYTIDETTLIK